MTTTKHEDAGAAELQAVTDEATAKGYYGSVPDPNPNSAYSLASGPDSPAASEALPAPPTPTKAAKAAKTKEKADG